MGKRIVLVGVGHVFDISRQVEEIIDTVNPDAIALELDKNRFSFLLNPQTRKEKSSLIYMILAKIQERIAKKYNVTTGLEMVTAIKKAKDKGIDILCIDKDIRQTLRMLWQSVSFERKVLFLLGGISSFFISKKKVDSELQSFEEEPASYFEHIENYFPEFKKVLIDDRNEFMYNNLLKALDMYDVVVTFVGEGHISGMQCLLDEYSGELNVNIIHLKNLRGNSWIELLSKHNSI